jgi:hypothetical protein
MLTAEVEEHGIPRIAREIRNHSTRESLCREVILLLFFANFSHNLCFRRRQRGC